MTSNNYERLPLHLRIEAGYRMSQRPYSKEKVTDTSDDLNISRSHLYSLETKYKEDPTMADRPREGRPPKIDEYIERRVLRDIHINPFQTSVEMASHVNAEMEEEKQISEGTVKAIAHMHGYSACRPLHKPPLDSEEMASRLEFCQTHQNRTMHFWRNVIFVDETYIRLEPKDSRKRVWRQEGEQIKPEHVLPALKFGGGGVMFWGCVSWMGPGPLVPIEGSLNGDAYARILAENMPQVKEALNVQSAYIIEDGSPVHGTLDVLRTKKFLNLKSLRLPFYSPDLNIIENLWSILKTRVAKRGPRSIDEFIVISQAEWTNISINDVRQYFYNIPNRIKAIINNNGKYSKY